jgi:hypothetical protein
MEKSPSEGHQSTAIPPTGYYEHLGFVIIKNMEQALLEFFGRQLSTCPLVIQGDAFHPLYIGSLPVILGTRNAKLNGQHIAHA